MIKKLDIFTKLKLKFFSIHIIYKYIIFSFICIFFNFYFFNTQIKSPFLENNISPKEMGIIYTKKEKTLEENKIFLNYNKIVNENKINFYIFIFILFFEVFLFFLIFRD